MKSKEEKHHASNLDHTEFGTNECFSNVIELYLNKYLRAENQSFVPTVADLWFDIKAFVIQIDKSDFSEQQTTTNKNNFLGRTECTKKYQIIKIIKINEHGKHAVIQKLRDCYLQLLHSILIDWIRNLG